MKKFDDLDQSHDGRIERLTSSLAPPLSTTGPKIFLVASLTHSGPFVTKSKKPDGKEQVNQSHRGLGSESVPNWHPRSPVFSLHGEVCAIRSAECGKESLHLSRIARESCFLSGHAYLRPASARDSPTEACAPAARATQIEIPHERPGKRSSMRRAGQMQGGMADLSSIQLDLDFRVCTDNIRHARNSRRDWELLPSTQSFAN